MTDRTTGKARLLRLAGAVALVAVVGHESLCTAAGDDAPRRKTHVRRDIMSLAPDGPEIAALRRGFAVMKSRPISDPTSWDFQVGIHATKDLSKPDVWNQCQHGNYFFLPWHRMYIYWFERILREASGDPLLTLPYWNYASPAARALPEVYRVPAGSSNPLYIAERNTDAGGINNGARLPASAAATSWLPFRLTNFSTALPSGAAFGGRVVAHPVHLLSTMGSFESYHNAMHVLIGGENGYMSDPTGSSRDPVFFAHHANVDRLWNRWLDQGGGRANPLDDRNWLDTRFKFFDEHGRPQEIAVRDALDEQHLGYRYDDDPTPLTRPWPVKAAPARPLTPVAASQGHFVELGTDGPLRVAVDLGDNGRAAVAREDGTLAILVEGIRFEKEPMIIYEVYIDLPEGEPADFQGVHFAGNLVFAGLPPSPSVEDAAAHGSGHHQPTVHSSGHDPLAAHGSGHHRPTAAHKDLNALRAIEITEVVSELRARKLWDDRRLTVTFVMRGLIPVKGAPVTRAEVKARFDRVTLAGSQ